MQKGDSNSTDGQGHEAAQVTTASDKRFNSDSKGDDACHWSVCNDLSGPRMSTNGRA